ncbi:MAG: LacI family transcriptional regulator [Chloroflexi bacterium]|nr:MAG: LacI family transcriptional regulator [Chloroflexota bacterium]
MANIRQVADKAGVSIGTVSRVLNNKPGVGKKTREHVLAVAHELGYSPSKYSPNISPEVTHLGFLSSFRTITTNPFYADVFHGVEQACQDLHINLSVSSLSVENHQLQRIPRLVKDNYINGLVVAGGVISPEIFITLSKLSHVPMTLVDNHFDLCPWDTVMTDNVEGARLAVEHLVSKGHRHIAMLGGPNHPSIVERRTGYKNTLRKHGFTPLLIAPPEIRSDITGLTPTGGACGVVEMLQQVPQTTAIFCSNDEQAVGALKKLQELGYAVPDDFSLVGFDNTHMVQFTSPPVTTVSVDRATMGRIAVQLLLDRIQFPDRAVTKATIGVNLVERGSVAAPRNHKLAA